MCQHCVACSGLATLARTCVSLDALQEKMLHRSVLVSLGTCQKLRTKLMTSTDVPLYLFVFRETGREGEREGEKYQCERKMLIGCLLYAP